jgi:FtsP/CotA-like multicopper oxidase with cupredoxin domain
MSLTDRRGLLAGLGVIALLRAAFRTAAAQGSQSAALVATAEKIALRPDRSGAWAWTLKGPFPVARFKRGELQITLQNDLPAAIALCVRGIDGAPLLEPLLGIPPVMAGTTVRGPLALRQAGTYFFDPWLRSDSPTSPIRPLPLIVEEDQAVSTDRDEVLLIEDWRLSADGTALAPGTAPKDADLIYTINGVVGPEIPIKPRERLRIRFINGCQRSIVAAKIEGYEVQVVALDGAPAEPFFARNGALMLPPGGRADVLIDGMASPGSVASILLHDGTKTSPIACLVTSTESPVRPAPLPPASALPSSGLPDRLDLKNALRVDIPLEGSEWTTPANFAASSPPSFRTKTGRTVVLALTNRTASATTFHLHGHHFRLLDRLDDGWKPFWLDTLAVEPGQTQRIAFAAEHPGRYLIESTATDWAAPRLLRWYDVA